MPRHHHKVYNTETTTQCSKHVPNTAPTRSHAMCISTVLLHCSFTRLAGCSAAGLAVGSVGGVNSTSPPFFVGSTNRFAAGVSWWCTVIAATPTIPKLPAPAPPTMPATCCPKAPATAAAIPLFRFSEGLIGQGYCKRLVGIRRDRMKNGRVDFGSPVPGLQLGLRYHSLYRNLGKVSQPSQPSCQDRFVGAGHRGVAGRRHRCRHMVLRCSG